MGTDRDPRHAPPSTSGPASPPPGRPVAVLLAGGGGRRFGGPHHKLLTTVRGRPLFQWALAAALGSGLEVWVVAGAVPSTALDLPDGVTALANERWADGLATSLAVAVDHARAIDPDARSIGALVVGPSDQPFIPAEAWALVAGADPVEAIAVATYGGVRANPVRLPRAVWPLLPRTGDHGARDLLRSRPDLVIQVACPGNPADIDTLEDLARWNS